MASVGSQVPIPVKGVDYRGKVVLAPMVRSGELPSRLLALRYGADLVWGPETIDRSMIGTVRKVNPYTSAIEFTRLPSSASRPSAESPRESVIYKIHPERERGKLIFQIGTASPELAVEAAKLVAGDVSGIDVNAGCPKPFSTVGGMGAALLRDQDRLANILTALVQDVGQVYGIGISVKIRLLESHEKTAELVTRLCRTGITGLTVHCRTTPMRPRERAVRGQLSMIAQICRDEGVACLMNGDVKSRDDAERLVKEFGVDGAMIATAAETNPSCFRSEREGGLLDWPTVVNEYMHEALAVENRWANTKFLLAQLIPGKTDAYKSVVSCKGYRQACEVLNLHDLSTLAQEVDRRLHVNETRPSKAELKAQRNTKGSFTKRRPPQELELEPVSSVLYVNSATTSNGASTLAISV